MPFFFLNSCSIFCDEFEAVCHEVLVSSEKVDKEKLKENFRVSRRFSVPFTVTKRSLISFISNNLQVQEGKLSLIASGSQHEETLGFCQWHTHALQAGKRAELSWPGYKYSWRRWRGVFKRRYGTVSLCRLQAMSAVVRYTMVKQIFWGANWVPHWRIMHGWEILRRERENSKIESRVLSRLYCLNLNVII